MGNNNELLREYIPIAEFLSDILGKYAEVVIQDVKNEEDSVVFIKNEYKWTKGRGPS